MNLLYPNHVAAFNDIAANIEWSKYISADATQQESELEPASEPLFGVDGEKSGGVEGFVGEPDIGPNAQPDAHSVQKKQDG